MYRVVIQVTGNVKTSKFVFKRELMSEARRLAEELTQTGFWIPKARPATFMPPARIRSVELAQAEAKSAS